MAAHHGIFITLCWSGSEYIGCDNIKFSFTDCDRVLIQASCAITSPNVFYYLSWADVQCGCVCARVRITYVISTPTHTFSEHHVWPLSTLTCVYYGACFMLSQPALPCFQMTKKAHKLHWDNYYESDLVSITWMASCVCVFCVCVCVCVALFSWVCCAALGFLFLWCWSRSCSVPAVHIRLLSLKVEATQADLSRSGFIRNSLTDV